MRFNWNIKISSKVCPYRGATEFRDPSGTDAKTIEPCKAIWQYKVECNEINCPYKIEEL